MPIADIQLLCDNVQFFFWFLGQLLHLILLILITGIFPVQLILTLHFICTTIDFVTYFLSDVSCACRIIFFFHKKNVETVTEY